MQGKGIIQFFTAALILVCIYQLSFTWVVKNAESNALEFAKESINTEPDASVVNKGAYLDSVNNVIVQRKRTYLDSISNEVIYNLGIVEFTYQQCKDQQLNLGLDLQGGMSVVLQVSVEDIIKGMSNYSTDITFTKALELAKKRQSNSQEDFVTLFGKAFQETDANAKLAAIFSSKEYQNRINFNSTNEDVLKVIKEEANDAVLRTFNILRTRIDKFGVTQPSITLQEATGRIIVELPGVDDPQRVRKLLQSSAKLEFWETYENADAINYLVEANKVLKERTSLEDTSSTSDSTAIESDSSLLLKPISALSDSATKNDSSTASLNSL